MLQTQTVNKVPFYSKGGQKTIDVAILSLGNKIVLMAFDEAYVNKGVIIGETTAKIIDQLEKAKNAKIREMEYAAGNAVQAQSTEEINGATGQDKGTDVCGENTAGSDTRDTRPLHSV